VHFWNIKLLSSDAGCTTSGEQESGELKIPQPVGIFAFEGCYSEKIIVVTLAIPAPFSTIFSKKNGFFLFWCAFTHNSI